MQNETSSIWSLIFADLKSQERAEDIYGKAVAQGKMPEEVKENNCQALCQCMKKCSSRNDDEIVHIDASLAAMQLMLVARSYGYDTNAIGGYKKKVSRQILWTDEDRHVPVLLIALGKANEEGFESVRLMP